MGSLDKVLKSIKPLDSQAMEAARKRQDSLTKPLGSLGRLEALSVQIAGIMAAKRTPALIPLCHPILIAQVRVELFLREPEHIDITATVRSTGKTGVEMEALTAVSVAALTVYDMCKAIDRGMTIENIRLVKKSGGKSGLIQLEAL